MSLGELLTKTVNLTSTVDSIKTQIEDLSRKVEENRERIIRLESSEEVIAEKARSAAVESVNRMTIEIARDLERIKATLEPMQLPPTPEVGRVAAE